VLTPHFTNVARLHRCAASRIPARAARDIADIMGDPHLAATGHFKRRTHPTEGDWFAMKAPVRFGVALQPAKREPPLLGVGNAT
jgi:crotonobetainyl-CoA:carnitine CoA-transferase CaiB-like acyl-CoA transferase